MPANRVLMIIAFAFALAGCASTTLQRQTLKSYTVGVPASASIGETFLVDQKGSIETVRTWVGILYSSDGWKTEQRYSVDWVRKELLYSGRSGQTIEIGYREFRGGYAAPAFYQNLKYDISALKAIRFQNFRIDVLDADNQTLKFKIVSD